MMAPDYAHWHGMYEVAERFYQELIPQAREIAEQAIEAGNVEAGERVLEEIDAILARPEHKWFEQAKGEASAGVRPPTRPGSEVARVTAIVPQETGTSDEGTDGSVPD